MTKSLTEQWTIKWGRLAKRYNREEHEQWIAQRSRNKSEHIKQQEKCIERLKNQLAIATKALKETKDRLLKIELSNLNYEERHKLYDIMFADGVIDRALQEMEGVK